MCIRDSSSTPYQLYKPTYQLLGDKFYEITPARDISFAYGCLLYTSEAADERSSVDLGGRRIIKKKKNNEWTHDNHYKVKRWKNQQTIVTNH